MTRARKPYLERLTKSRQTNEFWASQLENAQTDGRRLDSLRSQLAGVERVSAADVQAAAREFLARDKAWRLVVVPKE